MDNAVISAYFGLKTDPLTTEVASRFKRIRAYGAASLEICGVADGQLDIYYFNVRDEDRSLRITDIAAGILVLREAGGEAYH